MTRVLQSTLVITAAIVCAGCAADPLWQREGGYLNPWGGDFLGLRSAQQRIQIRRIEQDWGVHKPDPYNPNNKP
jgi:hypothetical protein